MSGPYDYNQYPQQGYAQQGYPPQQPYGHGQQPYGGYPPQQGYPEGGFAPPGRQDSFGPPQHGGFQHGQQGGQFGMYDASNPQGHGAYFGSSYQDSHRDGHSQPPQSQYGQPQQPNYDPNAPGGAQEGERGLLGAAAGAFGGHKLGKSGGHGLLGTVGGAIMGSILEDKFKEKKHHGKSSGGSSWGGFGKYMK